MRKYNKNTGKIEKILCNKCGRDIVLDNGIIKEGIFEMKYDWGYFSKKDGETHEFELCEECYDNIVGQFKVGIVVKENIELL